jgi:DUF4097 and DUF4098 domain-containing protein YvlB
VTKKLSDNRKTLIKPFKKMKKSLSLFLVGMILSCTNSPAQKQVFKEHISKEFSVSSSETTLNVFNINGFIKVEGYAGNKIIIEIDKTISAKRDRDLEEGKSGFKLNFEQKNDEITAYISEPFDSRPNISNRHNNVHIDYDFKVNYTIKVPYSTNLRLSTINEGDVMVSDVKGEIKANNINGAITLKNTAKAYDVHTINGDVNINYTTLPPDNAKYYTLNGDLTVTYPANLSADCTFKSFQGEFFTDFPEVEVMPSKIKKVVEKDGESTKHKLEKGSNIKIGKGGLKLNFETFNGNIYIKKV